MNNHLDLMVLDKSYAQAVPAAELSRLDKRYVVLVPDAFYYEVFRNEPDKRRHALKGFPEFRRIHLPGILRAETRDGKPVVDADQPRLHFDEKVSELDWKLSPEHQEVMDDYQKTFLDPAVTFWNETMSGPVPGFTEAENDSLKFDKAYLELCHDLRNPSRVRAVAKVAGYPHADRLDPTWFHYRRYRRWPSRRLFCAGGLRAPLKKRTPNA